MKIVIALGGNALIKKGENGTSEQQEKNVLRVCREISKLVKKGHRIILVHGNGFQVGEMLLQQEKSGKNVPEMPIDVLDAMTQGQIGYWIQQNLRNLTKKEVITVLTQVLVDKKDSAFKKPTKPIGPFYSMKKSKNMIYDSGRGYRRVVPSPKPKRIVEIKAIEELMKKGIIVIACGGGGIPVIKEKNGLKGVEAVIDKDRATQVLANELKADIIIDVTSVSNAYLNFGKKNQKALKRIKVKQAKKYLEEGHFASGSMKPKIEAGIAFVKKGGKRMIITSLDNVVKSLNGKAGTSITK